MTAPSLPVLIGREQELSRVAHGLEAGIASSPRVVSIEGEAGVGKTALVRAALAQIDGDVTVLHLQGDEFVQSVGFAALHPWLVPEAEAEVFQVARTILARLDDVGPAVLVVEDLHWVDVPTRQALAIAVSRLSHEPVAVLATARPDHVGVDDGWARLRQDATMCERIRLPTLGWAEVAALAAQRGVALDAAAAQRLTEHTGGNPLYVVTLLDDVPPHVLKAPGLVLPVPADLAEVVVSKVAGIGEDTAAFLGALAVLGRPSSLPLLGEVAGLAAPSAAFERAAIAKLVERTNVGDPGSEVVSFVHPLIRRAVYDSLSPHDRRRFHRSAARVGDHRAALTHRVAAADHSDDALAVELEAESLTARRDEGAAVAAQLLRWASELSSARPDRERRLIRAAHLLITADDSAATQLIAEIERCGASAERDLVMGELAWQAGDVAESTTLLRRAAAASDESTAVEALVRLAQQMVVLVRPDDAIAAAEGALERGIADPALEAFGWAMFALGVGERDGAVAGLERLRERLPESPRECAPVDTGLLSVRGLLGVYALRHVAAADDLSVALGRSRTMLPARRRAHVDLAQCQVALGRWNEATLNARRALELSDDQHPLERSIAHQVLSSVAAGRGRWDEAERELQLARDVAAAFGTVESALAVRRAVAAVADARGLPASNEVASVGATVPMLSVLSMFHPTAVAQIEAADLDRAATTIERFDDAATQRGLDVAAQVAELRARLAVRIGDADGAEHHFRSAVAAVTENTPALNTAAIHVGYGRFLRSQSRRHDAIEHLRAARAVYESLGATPYLDRVDEELTASGLSRPTKRRDRSPLDLTPREQDVVTLVVDGRTNKEVAAELFISTKAVEYHLRNVYGKVGVSSRRELAAKLAVAGEP